jgi:hypothetical protein
MGGRQVPDWEAEKQQRRANARNRNHEGEYGEACVINEKPHTPLSHEGEGVPWKPTYPLTQKGLQNVQDFLTAVAKSIRDGKPSSHGDHTQRTSCLRGRGGAMGRGPTSRSRSASASCVIWGASGSTHTPISQTG